MPLKLIRNNIQHDMPFFTVPIVFNANENQQRPIFNTRSCLPRGAKQEKECLDQESWSQHVAQIYDVTPLAKVATIPQLVGQGSFIGLNDQIEILKAALNKEDSVGSPDAVWLMMTKTIKKLDLRNRQGKEWFLPAAGDPNYRPDTQGGLILRLIGHRVVIKSSGAFRIDEFRKNGVITIFQKGDLS